jgi:hypothetical protein
VVWFRPPDNTETALINSTPYGPAVIDLTCLGVAGSLIISQFGNQAELNVHPGGSLHVYGETILGNYSDKGILNIMGAVTIDTDLSIGYFVPNYSGTDIRALQKPCFSAKFWAEKLF